MHPSRWNRSRFDTVDQDPLFAMSNLVDIMLVFTCGLVAALAAQQQLDLDPDRSTRSRGGEEIVAGRELPDLPAGVGELGRGFEAVGRVYRDPQSGKMVLIGSDVPD